MSYFETSLNKIIKIILYWFYIFFNIHRIGHALLND